MNNTMLHNALKTLLGICKSLKAITGGVEVDAPLEEVGEALRRRGELIDEMHRHTRTLSKLDPSWVETAQRDSALAVIEAEVRQTALATAEIDKRITRMLRERMCGVENQLGRLPHASRAARSYTAHSTLQPRPAGVSGT